MFGARGVNTWLEEQDGQHRVELSLTVNVLQGDASETESVRYGGSEV